MIKKRNKFSESNHAFSRVSNPLEDTQSSASGSSVAENPTSPRCNQSLDSAEGARLMAHLLQDSLAQVKSFLPWQFFLSVDLSPVPKVISIDSSKTISPLVDNA